MRFFGRGITLRESGIFHDYTDAHCHILPGVDDGVKDMSESLEILDEYEKMGINDVILTSHIMEDIPNGTSFLRQRFVELRQVYSGGILLHLASENMIDNLFDKRFAQRDFLPMPGGSLLVETSYFTPPLGLYDRISGIFSAGYVPVLAHPERYMYMDQHDYFKLKGLGVKFQLNIPSLVGMYGQETLAKASWLLDKGMYDFSGTDLHSRRMLDEILSESIPRNLALKANKLSFRF